MSEREVRFLSSLGRRLVIGLLASLPFCAAATVPAPLERPRAEVANDAPAAPELMAYGPLRMLLLSGEDAAGSYYSVVSKATFAIDAQGRLTLLGQGGEPLLDAKTDPSVSYDCRAHGASYNQRTTWFPYTALFVRGGTLARVDGNEGKRPLRPLSADAESAGATMSYAGTGAREPEYSYAACVGPHRVAQGDRLDGYLAASDRMTIRDAVGKRMTLALPQPFAPFVLARYHSGAIIPVPMRIVVATIDLAERRVVLQLQATLSRTPPLRKLELRAVLDDGKPDPGESAARYRERTQALLGDLARCAPPRVHAIEPCADPQRLPDPRIFFSTD